MIGKIFQEDAYDGDEGGGEVSVIACGTAVRLSVAYGMEDHPASVTPATADAIASALHVAAAQVRSARGGKVAKAAPVPALFFDKDGFGPEYTAIEVTNLRGFDDKIPDSLGMRIVSDPTLPGCVRTDALDGGFMMDRASVVDLHAELGAWLAAHPAEVK